MELLAAPNTWISLTTLTVLEIVLGIDNLVFIAVIVMLAASGPVSAFVNRHPTVKMLAFSFLILIGMALVADGAGFHIPKGYLYFAVGFSIFVEGLNIWARKKKRRTA